jgi:predicted DNA-binding protein (UPF0251 family)/predicted RNA-binding Zn-ribbon protein involved in translation (DUF1610 family)
MSPRKKVLRKVLNPPLIKGFKPYGRESGKQNLEPVNLLYEEYESLRLSDYDILNHHQASEMMGVSRPTFTRIYASALQKIAKAFVEGRQISIEGGKVYFDSDWYQCDKCHCNFNNPEREKEIKSCPICGGDQIKRYDFDRTINGSRKKNCIDSYVCPDCGFEQILLNEDIYNRQVCPECNSLMKRKEISNC